MNPRDPRYEDGRTDRGRTVGVDARSGLVERLVNRYRDRLTGFRWRLLSAATGETAETYLVRAIRDGLRWGAAAAVAVGAAVALHPAVASPVGPTVAVGPVRLAPLAAVAAAILGSAVVALGVVGHRWIAPRLALGRQRRAIDAVLPNAVVYMYALSHGGVTLVEMLRDLSRERAAYGELAVRFDHLTRDVDLLGDDLYTALRNARDYAPSEDLERFLDDLVSVLQSGGGVRTFLGNEAEHHLEIEREHQEEFLDLLGTFAEGFITVIFAGTIFLLIVLVTLSMSGADTLGLVLLLVYVGVPAGIAVALAGLMLLTAPFSLEVSEVPGADGDDEAARAADDERYGTYRSARRRRRLRQRLGRAYTALRDRPPLVLVVTVPASLLLLGVLALLREGTPGFGLHGEPLRFTAEFVVLPLLVNSVPLSVFVELNHRRKEDLRERFPNVLDTVANASRNGIGFVDALALASRQSTGALADEMVRVRRDIAVTDDVAGSLIALSRRLRVASIARSLHIVARGSRYTNDLGDVLAVTAEDLRNRHRLQRERRAQMRLYTVVFVLGVLIYLGIVVMLNRYLFPPLLEVAAAEEFQDVGVLSIGTAQGIEAYRVAFFHSALLQVAGTSMVVGRLERNDILSGLKYANVLAVVVVAVFLLL